MVAIFASPVAATLLRYAKDVGFAPFLVEPGEVDIGGDFDLIPAYDGMDDLLTQLPNILTGADVVVTDHHRPELGEVLRVALASDARWIGVMGNPRHQPGPHVEALRALDVPEDQIARVHRPIGLNIGSRTPPEIAIATLAGLLADHNNRPGGFTF